MSDAIKLALVPSTISLAHPCPAAEISASSVRAADVGRMRTIVDGDAGSQDALMHQDYILNGPSNRVLRQTVLVDMLANGKVASAHFETAVEDNAITGNTGVADWRLKVDCIVRQQLECRGKKTMMEPRQHWESVYQTKRPTDVSWYRPHLDVSLRLVEEAVASRDAHIIDVGAGASTLIDDLLARGYRNLSALDLSATALDVSKGRLGADASRVNWLCGDACTFPFPPQQYDLWHDRAVFHFPTDSADRAAYVRQVARAVKPGGHVIVATFGPEGPTKCSGLEVTRYGPQALHDEFGPDFHLIRHHTELHHTPMGSTQQFTYCCCRLSPCP